MKIFKALLSIIVFSSVWSVVGCVKLYEFPDINQTLFKTELNKVYNQKIIKASEALFHLLDDEGTLRFKNRFLNMNRINNLILGWSIDDNVYEYNMNNSEQFDFLEDISNILQWSEINKQIYDELIDNEELAPFITSSNNFFFNDLWMDENITITFTNNNENPIITVDFDIYTSVINVNFKETNSIVMPKISLVYKIMK